MQVRMKPNKITSLAILSQQHRADWQRLVMGIEFSCRKLIAEIIIEVIAYLQIWKTTMKLSYKTFLKKKELIIFIAPS